MRIVFIGPPGVGKGTQSERVIKHLGITHLSTGDMLREACEKKTDLGLLSQEFMNQGKLVPDPIILQLVGHRLDEADCQGGYLLDGFPRTLGQAQALDEFLERRGTPLDLVLELKVDTEELIKRLEGRGRFDDKPDIIRRRLEEYNERTAPLSSYYHQRGLLKLIDGGGTPNEVFARIREVLDRGAREVRR